MNIWRNFYSCSVQEARQMKKQITGHTLTIKVPRGQEGMDMLKDFLSMFHLPTSIPNPRVMSDGKITVRVVHWIQLKYPFAEVYVTDQTKDGLTRVIWFGQKAEDKWINLEAFRRENEINHECPMSMSLLPPKGWEWVSSN
jgi:hypothetical protein